jgi:hypothetical protein
VTVKEHWIAAALERLTITFVDSVARGRSSSETFTTSTIGTWKARVTIPADATAGAHKVTAVGSVSLQKATATFTAT